MLHILILILFTLNLGLRVIPILKTLTKAEVKSVNDNHYIMDVIWNIRWWPIAYLWHPPFLEYNKSEMLYYILLIVFQCLDFVLNLWISANKSTEFRKYVLAVLRNCSVLWAHDLRLSAFFVALRFKKKDRKIRPHRHV